MRGFHYFDLAALGTMAVAGDHQAGKFAFPGCFDGFGHGGGRLASTDDDGAPAAVGGQIVGQDLAWVSRIDGGGEQLTQQGLRIEAHVQLLLMGSGADSRP